MLSENDGELRRELAESNIYPFEHDKYLRILDGVLADQGLEADDVLALSDSWQGLVVVCRTGIGRGVQRGVFNKRVEVGDFIPHESVSEIVSERRQPHGRESWIKLLGGEGRTLVEFAWHAGGPVEIADAARERDRVFAVMREALNAPQPTPASTAPPITAFNSKRDFLLSWGRALVDAAGLPTTPELVEEHANMAAGTVRMMVFLRLGARHGIEDLNQYFPDGGLPSGAPLDSFDPLYERVVQVEGGPQAVDPQIVTLLDNCWSDWVRGAREAYS